MEETGHIVMRMIAQTLELPSDFFQRDVRIRLALVDVSETVVMFQLVRESYWGLRALRYPAGSSSKRKADEIGCGEHTDYGCLTFINSDEIPGALQVKTANGTWVSADPIEGMLVVNLGVGIF